MSALLQVIAHELHRLQQHPEPLEAITPEVGEALLRALEPVVARLEGTRVRPRFEAAFVVDGGVGVSLRTVVGTLVFGVDADGVPRPLERVGRDHLTRPYVTQSWNDALSIVLGADGAS